ncbi:ABC transporter permease [soil metagenome]
MLTYYLELGLRSCRSARGLTLLMLLSIAMGVAACMTTLTVFHVLSGDPIPGKSDRLFNVQLDAEAMAGYVPGSEPELQLTRFDAETLLREQRGVHQVMMSGAGTLIDPSAHGGDVGPFFASARHTSADFFTMFEAPFLFGKGWSAAEDGAEARVVVLSRATNERAFEGKNSVGQVIRLRDKDFTVIGVLNDWRPTPHYFDLTLGAFNKAAEVYLPFSTAVSLKFGSTGNFNCWTNAVDPRALNAACAWVQYWVQLDTAAQQAEYRSYLHDYSERQRAAGRFERPSNERLRAVMTWLSVRKVVPSDVQLQVWLAFGFLVVCLTNAVGLLLAKCLRRSAEIGVRRALGAPRSAIFMQFLVEAGSLGLIGGLLGLALTELGLWAVRQNPSSYAHLAELDGTMLLATLGLALAASLLAGLLPAWRACQVTPAIQLKTQ